MKHYGLKGQLCILIALLLLTPVVYFGDYYANSYPQPDHTTVLSYSLAGYKGEAPDWFGGWSQFRVNGQHVIFVVEDCKKTRLYFENALGPEHGWKAGDIVRVKYSLNEASMAFLEVKQLLQEEWRYTYDYSVSAGLLTDERGYRIHISLQGDDAQWVWDELQNRYGDLVVEDAGTVFWEHLLYMGISRELAVKFVDEWEPLRPISLKSVVSR